METTVSTKGQIVIPAELREKDDIKPGQRFAVERIDRGEYRFVRMEDAPNDGLVDWLVACPVKDYFVSIDSESTDEL